MSIDIRIITDQEEGVAILTVGGEVDIATIPELESSIASLENGKDLVIDLTSTEFMDSTGIRLLMSANERYRESGRKLKVAIDKGPISRLLDVTGVFAHLDTYPSVADALSR